MTKDVSAREGHLRNMKIADVAVRALEGEVNPFQISSMLGVIDVEIQKLILETMADQKDVCSGESDSTSLKEDMVFNN